MRKQLWQLYMYTCVRTPIAALLILFGLTAGMLTLMNSFTIQNYVKVPAVHVEDGAHALLTVQGKYDFSSIHQQDKIIWYTGQSDERLEGTVLNIESGTAGAGKLVVETRTLNIVNGENDTASASPAQTAGQYYVELPLGKQTVFAKLFRKGEAK